MMIIVATIIIIAVLCGVLIFLLKGRSSVGVGAFEGQYKAVQHLLRDLNENVFQIIPSRKASREVALRFTLRDVMNLHDNDGELSGEEFEDDRIFFQGEEQLVDLKKYLHNELIPKRVLYELNHFHNSRFIVADPSYQNFFTVISSVKNASDKLYEGNADAFESWLNFQEYAHNLFYVINQWLKENAVASSPKGAVFVK